MPDWLLSYKEKAISSVNQIVKMSKLEIISENKKKVQKGQVRGVWTHLFYYFQNGNVHIKHQMKWKFIVALIAQLIALSSFGSNLYFLQWQVFRYFSFEEYGYLVSRFTKSLLMVGKLLVIVANAGWWVEEGWQSWGGRGNLYHHAMMTLPALPGSTGIALGRRSSIFSETS